MGLFDKMREIVNSTLGEGALVSKSSADDPVVKRYYGVILVLLSTVGRLTKEHIKLYFRVRYNEECDDASLDKALSKFETIEGNPTRYKLSWQAERVKSPDVKKEDVLDICYAPFRATLKSKFEEILSTLEQKPQKRFLMQGFSALGRAFRWSDEEYYLAGKVISEVMTERLLSKDPTVVSLVVEEAFEYLKPHKSLPLAHAVALRALHFEKYGETLNEYESITIDDCKNTVISSSAYAKDLEEHLFDKDAFVAQTAHRILSKTVLDRNNSEAFGWKQWAAEDMHFIDAACYFAVQKISESFNECTPTTIDSAVNLVAAFMLNE